MCLGEHKGTGSVQNFPFKSAAEEFCPWSSSRFLDRPHLVPACAAGELRKMFCCGCKTWSGAAHAISQHELMSVGSGVA